MSKPRFLTAAICSLVLITGTIAARAETAAPSPTSTAAETSTPVPSPSPSPTASGPCSAKLKLKDSDLATPYVYVVNLETGQVLLDVRGDLATPSASVMKLVTMAWATDLISSTYTAKTRVLTNPDEPSTLILQGGGDHTLSRLTGTSYTTYGTRVPRLETLVTQTLALLPPDVPIKKIVVDASFFEGGGWNKNWWEGYRDSGDMSIITALQVDADRTNPDLTDVNYKAKRTAAPIQRVAKLFKTGLGEIAKDAKLVYARAPQNSVELTSVSSRTIIHWMRHALMVSDNTETEMIAFHASKASGHVATWAWTTKLARRYMRSIGYDPNRLTFSDNSGLASSNRLTAKAVVTVIQSIWNKPDKLATFRTLLPVSGISGSLATRLTGELRGKVSAKVGHIPGLTSLAGWVDAADGSHLGFAIFARSLGKTKITYSTKPAIDELVKRFYFCGNWLTK